MLHSPGSYSTRGTKVLCLHLYRIVPLLSQFKILMVDSKGITSNGSPSEKHFELETCTLSSVKNSRKVPHM